jgi:hypothetical protein
MADPEYPLAPRLIGDGKRAWFYEEKTGLHVIIDGEVAVLSWKRVAAAVDRHRRIRASKRKTKR